MMLKFLDDVLYDANAEPIIEENNEDSDSNESIYE